MTTMISSHHKLKLYNAIIESPNFANWTQRELMIVLRIPQAKVSNLIRGYYNSLTTDMLLDVLDKLNYTVHMEVKPSGIINSHKVHNENYHILIDGIEMYSTPIIGSGFVKYQAACTLVGKERAKLVKRFVNTSGEVLHSALEYIESENKWVTFPE